MLAPLINYECLSLAARRHTSSKNWTPYKNNNRTLTKLTTLTHICRASVELMSKANPSTARSKRRGTKHGLPTQPMIGKCVRFTLDNEEVHTVSLNWENEGPSEGKARTTSQFLGSFLSVAHSPSDQMASKGHEQLPTTMLVTKSA